MKIENEDNEMINVVRCDTCHSLWYSEIDDDALLLVRCPICSES